MNTVAGYSRTMLSLAAALSVTLGGCGTRSDALPTAVVQAFEQAFSSDDLDATLALFDDDAQILPERGPAVSGRQDIAAFLKDQMTPVVSFNTEADMSMIRDDIAIEQGHYACATCGVAPMLKQAYTCTCGAIAATAGSFIA